MSFAGMLRQELSDKAQHYACENNLPHCLTYGQGPTVCFQSDEANFKHGNFLPPTYRAILRNSNWRRRLQKVHTQGKSLPQREQGSWHELDACTSSDALLMNVFCHPRTLKSKSLRSLLNLYEGVVPEFGVKARVPLLNGKFDRTEVDMRLGDLLVEAKLTESNFQRAPRKAMSTYRDFGEIFNCEELPQNERVYYSYQLLRNVLAAHATGCAFCVLTDARRPELIESWYAVMKCIRPVELRMRCMVLTWQEVAKCLPYVVKRFLSDKYGID